jgi:hypothetical protein
MKQKLILSTLLLASLTGCVNNGYPATTNSMGNYEQTTTNRYPATTAPSSYPASTQNPIPPSSTSPRARNNGIQQSLAYMYDEERLAKELYLAIYAKQPVKQLYNIASRAEGRHIDAVNTLAQKYGVATPPQQTGRYQHPEIQNLFNELYSKGIRSQRDALEVGCMAEVVDIDDLNKYIGQAQQANAQDVLQTFTFLRKGSYNHYWAFDKGLKKLGVSNGCCSLGQQYCHSEYPKKERGQGHGEGQGRGQGHGRGGQGQGLGRRMGEDW